MRFMTILVLMVSFVIVGCSLKQKTQPIVFIEWANIIKLNGITYHVETSKNTLKGDSLDYVYAKVKFTLDGNINDPNYKIKDGDATYISTGTPIYTMKNYSPEFRLAVKWNDGIQIFESDTNPKAKKGSDLLDIDDKVVYIGINSQVDGTTELASIKGVKQVSYLVDLVLNSPVDQNRQYSNSANYFISFHLKDGTSVNRAYWTEAGELLRGIMMPTEFRVAIEKALDSKTR